MSHYHCEVILPPARAEDYEAAVGEVLAPFDENGEGEDHDPRHVFWDFWKIGGRWAGDHVMGRYDPERMERFHEELRRREFTVSSLVFGKEELQSASQAAEVDALWRDHFPDSGLDRCPIFQHANPRNQGHLLGDVCRVSELGKWATAERVIIAGPTYDHDSSKHVWRPLEAAYMTQEEFWNGVTHVEARWDGKVASAIEVWNEERQRYAPEYAAMLCVGSDHLAVTVDYHS